LLTGQPFALALDAVEDLLSMHQNVEGRFKPETRFVASDIDARDAEQTSPVLPQIDNYGFILVATENKHARASMPGV
jgi:hypothetical protein